MLRPLLRLRNELFDAFGPVKSITDLKKCAKKIENVQFFLLPENKMNVRSTRDKQGRKKRRNTYLELDSNFTESLTSWMVCLEPEGADLLPPDAAAYDNPTVLRSVPRARYSVLTARPRIVLKHDDPVSHQP